MSSSQMVTVKDKVNTVRDLLAARKEQIAMALPKHITPERLMRVSLNAFIRTPKLLDCTKESLVGAVMECATLGLEPVFGQAWILPYGNQATFIPGYKGLLALARRSGEISTIQVAVVKAKDHFRFVRGLHPVLEHVEADDDDRGEVTHFWACATMKDGGAQFEVMRKADVDAIRNNSPSANSKSSPWQTHYEEMGKKTLVRRLCKLLPASIEFQRAANLDEMAEVGIPQNLGAEIILEPVPRKSIAESTGLSVAECSHTDGFATTEEGSERVCIHCGATEDQE